MPTRFGSGKHARITYTPQTTIRRAPARVRGSRVASGSGQFQDRHAPERIPGGGNDDWLAAGAGHAMQAPSRALEVFPAAANVLSGGRGEGGPVSWRAAGEAAASSTAGPREKGLFDTVTETIGRIGAHPFRSKPEDNPFSIEGMIAGIGGFMKESWTWGGAVKNAPDADLYRRIVAGNLRADDPLPEVYGKTFLDHLPGAIGSVAMETGKLALRALTTPQQLIGVGPLTHDPTEMPARTVGDFEQELANRGWFDEWDEDTQTNKHLTSREVIAKMDAAGALGNYQFGDKMISESAMIDMGFRLLADPTNIALGMGLPANLASKVAGAGRWGFSHVFRGGPTAAAAARYARAMPNVAHHATPLGERAFGVGFADDMVQAGVMTPRPVSIRQGAANFFSGDPSATGLGSLGLGIRYLAHTPPAVGFQRLVFPNYLGGGLGRRFALGSTQAQLGLMATQGGVGAAKDALGDDFIFNGPLSALHDLSESILNNRPLSGDPAFVMLAAFNYPAMGMAKAAVGHPGGGGQFGAGARGVLHHLTGDNYLGYVARQVHAQSDAPFHRYQVRGKQQEAATVDMFRRRGPDNADGTPGPFLETAAVGRDRFNKWADLMNQNIAWRRTQSSASSIIRAKSFAGIVGVGGRMAEVLREKTNALLAAGKINAKDAFDTFSLWYQEHRSSYIDPETGLVKHMDFPGGVKVPFQTMVDEFIDFDYVMSEISTRVGPMDRAIAARGQNMLYEGVDYMLTSFDDIVGDGVNVSTDWMATLTARNLAMFTDPAIPPATRSFFLDMLNEGVQSGTGKYKGTEKRTYDASTVREHIVALRDAVVKGPEMFHEGTLRERAIIDDMSPMGGPLSPGGGGLTRMWDPKEIKAAEVRSTADGLALSRDLARDKAAYDARWQRREEALLTEKAQATETALRRFRVKYEASDGSTRTIEVDAANALDAQHLAETRVWDTVANPRATEIEPTRGYRTAQQVADDIKAKMEEGPITEQMRRDLNQAQQRADSDAAANFSQGPRGKATWADWKETATPGARVTHTTTGQEGTVVSQGAKHLTVKWDESGSTGRVVAPAYDLRPAEAAKPDLTALRQAERDALAEKVARLDEIKKDIYDIKQRAAEIGYTELHGSWQGKDGQYVVSGEELAGVQAMAKLQQERWPALTIKRTPENHLPWSAADSLVGALNTQRTAFGRALYDYGPIAKFTQFLEYLTEPVSSSKRVKDSHNMIHSMMRQEGASADQVVAVLADLKESMERAGTMGAMRSAVARSETSLFPSTINRSFVKILGEDSPVLAAIVKRWKEPYRLIDQASNSLARRGEQAIFQSARVNIKDYKSWSGHDLLSRTFASGYAAFQSAPGISLVSSSLRYVRIFYPIARFQMSARWQIQNLIENRIIAIAQDGFRALGIGKARSKTIIERNAYDTVEARNFKRNAPKGEIEGAALPEGLDLLKADRTVESDVPDFVETGVHSAYFLEPVMRGQHALRSFDDSTRMINELPSKHPDLIWMEKRFGPLAPKKEWAGLLNDMLYNFDHKGVEPTLRGEARQIQTRDRWTPEEILEFEPFLERVIERHTETYADIVAMQIGNISRPRIERLMNSYWLFWPLSYQIKTTKFMVDMLSNRMFGRQTNLGGAYLLTRMREVYEEQMKTNPYFRHEMENNETIWRAYNMLLPAVPWDHSLSLSRLPRYIGANVLGWWPEYAGLNGPGDYARKMLEMGPYYDTILWGSLGEEFEEQPTMQRPIGER